MGKSQTFQAFLIPRIEISQRRRRGTVPASLMSGLAKQSPPIIVTPFCPAPQLVSGSFLFLEQCQGARREHRMQILPHPGFM